MAGGEGFEPSTPNLGGWCSIQPKPHTKQHQPLRNGLRNPYWATRPRHQLKRKRWHKNPSNNRETTHTLRRKRQKRKYQRRHRKTPQTTNQTSKLEQSARSRNGKSPIQKTRRQTRIKHVQNQTLRLLCTKLQILYLLPQISLNVWLWLWIMVKLCSNRVAKWHFPFGGTLCSLGELIVNYGGNWFFTRE